MKKTWPLDTAVSFDQFAAARLIDKALQALFKLFRTLSGGFNVCDPDALIRLGKRLVVLPDRFILPQRFEYVRRVFERCLYNR